MLGLYNDAITYYWQILMLWSRWSKNYQEVSNYREENLNAGAVTIMTLERKSISWCMLVQTWLTNLIDFFEDLICETGYALSYRIEEKWNHKSQIWETQKFNRHIVGQKNYLSQITALVTGSNWKSLSCHSIMVDEYIERYGQLPEGITYITECKILLQSSLLFQWHIHTTG